MLNLHARQFRQDSRRVPTLQPDRQLIPIYPEPPGTGVEMRRR